MNHSQWNVLPPAPASLLGVSPLPPLVTQLLFNRGLATPQDFELFIAGDKRLCGDPFQMPGVQRAMTRIYRALLGGETIAVYGDFDADGITATALLVEGITLLGGKAVPYIPHRLTEGYGIKTPVLEKLRQDGIRLVVTVDCGITALAEVKRARRTGQDIIITDHHMPLPELPPALAIVSARVPGSAYPFSELTGVGVALKLLEALLQGVGKLGELERFSDLAAVGTVADMAPLVGENRYLVKEGLRVLNFAARPGIRELMAVCGLDAGRVDAESISWMLAPRLNAAGRLEHAMSSYRLLTTDSSREARELAVWLEHKNAERQRLTSKYVGRAREQVLSKGITPLLIAVDEDYPPGIAGLVAGKLTEEFYRPTLVIRLGEIMSSGSCRSIPEFNITLGLQQCRRLLRNFGGHSQAAGFTLPTRNLERFAAMLSGLAAASLEGVDLRPRLDIDAGAALAELNGETFRVMQKLAPFGRGNPLPAFLCRGVEVADCRTMGNAGEHLRLKLRQGGALRDAVAFRSGEFLGEMAQPLDIVCNIELDRWAGAEKLRLNILDFAPARLD